MRRIVLGFMVALLVVFGISAMGHAAGKSNLVLIFDASGSMWGQIDGKAKITIAKEAMALIVKDLPGDINVGLVAYGHRREGDCDDVETLIPLGPLNRKAFLHKVNALNPKGKTPMVRSIQKTAGRDQAAGRRNHHPARFGRQRDLRSGSVQFCRRTEKAGHQVCSPRGRIRRGRKNGRTAQVHGRSRRRGIFSG